MELGPPGVAEMLSSPEHYRRVEMHVVDYGQARPEIGPLGWEPLADAKPEPPESPRAAGRASEGMEGT